MWTQAATATKTKSSRYKKPPVALLSSLFYSTLLLTVLCNSAVAIRNGPVAFISKKSSNNRNNNNKMAAKKKNDATNDSSALSELKDTIKSQAAEINRLRAELAKKDSGVVKKVPSGGGHGHHGGGGSDKEDILNYKNKSFVSIATERVPWLALFLISLSFTAIIMNGFEHTLSKQIELAYFVPLMAGHGGNTGGQAVGTVLSALSAGVITRQDAAKVVGKEAASGLIMGMTLGALVGPITHYVMGISKHVATVVSVTFPLLSTIAATLGSSLPFVCVILGLDPAVIAAPAMTSFVDVSGLLCYFLIANKIFKAFGLEL